MGEGWKECTNTETSEATRGEQRKGKQRREPKMEQVRVNLRPDNRREEISNIHTFLLKCVRSAHAAVQR